MAGVDQKSFLTTFSPWSTPRTSTPQPDRAGGTDVLQRSQGEDHTVTHRHKLSRRHYPAGCPPLKVRWFYAVDSPKRKPALLESNKSDQKPPPPPKKFVAFSLKDSQSIETTFQKLSELEDAQEHQHAQQRQEVPPKKVPVNEDYLFDVDVEQRELSPAYWIGPVYEVRRGMWFFQDGSGLKPCEENLATQLEEGYIKLRPWEGGISEVRAPGPDTAEASVPQSNDQDALPSDSVRHHPHSQGTSKGSDAPTPESRQYRLFGAYMNRIVAYQDASTAWLTTDDFMSRVSTTVFQKLGGVPGTKVVRGLVDAKRQKEALESKSGEQKSADERTPRSASPEAPTTQIDRSTGLIPEDPLASEKVPEDIKTRPKSTLERQMSSLAGEPQNPVELEEQARRQEEQEMENLREVEGEDRDREVDHLILVTHGIGQRLGLRLESINFIHDVNVLRKTLKGVYKASPDLQALNAAFADSNGNCRVQVLPV